MDKEEKIKDFQIGEKELKEACKNTDSPEKEKTKEEIKKKIEDFLKE